MSAPPFALLYTAEAEQVIGDLAKRTQYATKLKKVRKALRLLQEVGPTHPGLQSHKYESVKGPNGEEVWESYVENHAPSAWRVWWVYGPPEDTITVVTIGPILSRYVPIRQVADQLRDLVVPAGATGWYPSKGRLKVRPVLGQPWPGSRFVAATPRGGRTRAGRRSPGV